jgi:hypothetical protein
LLADNLEAFSRKTPAMKYSHLRQRRLEQNDYRSTEAILFFLQKKSLILPTGQRKTFSSILSKYGDLPLKNLPTFAGKFSS